MDADPVLEGCRNGTHPGMPSFFLPGAEALFRLIPGRTAVPFVNGSGIAEVRIFRDSLFDAPIASRQGGLADIPFPGMVFPFGVHHEKR